MSNQHAYGIGINVLGCEWEREPTFGATLSYGGNPAPGRDRGPGGGGRGRGGTLYHVSWMCVCPKVMDMGPLLPPSQ